MEESYEYANEFGKQGRKNPRYIPKITINRELFSRTKIYAHAQSLGILSIASCRLWASVSRRQALSS